MIYPEHSHTLVMQSWNQTDRRAYKESRLHPDFSYNNGSDNADCNRSPGYRYQFSKNTTNRDFQQYFAARGYTENQILNQRCLYMFDDFVKFAQTYSSYKCTIQQLHAELKNLNIWQKAYHRVKGTYCIGLQKRIHFLYDQLDSIKIVQQQNNNSFLNNNDNHFPLLDGSCKRAIPVIYDHSVEMFASQRSEYNALESTYCAYTPSLSNAIEKRSEAYSNMTSGDYLHYATKSYNLNNNVEQLLSQYGHDTTRFTQCYGNQLEHVIHQESLNFLDRIDRLPRNSILHDHQEALIDFTVAMVDYNHEGLTNKAMDIGDLCWTLLDYGQAVTEGAALGVYSAAQDIVANPFNTALCIVAGKEVLVFQLSKVLYNVADIGVTALVNPNSAKEKWNKYTEPLNNIIDAIYKKEITLRDAIKGGTAFVVGWKAQGKLLGGLGKFCNTIKQKSIEFVKNNPLLKPAEYLTTPEGLLFKATAQSNKFQQTESTSSVEKLKNTVEKLSGTVWKNIKPTDKMYPGTKIPKSFEIAIGKQKFWVAPSATKHMKDYIIKNILTHTMPIDSQILLTTFEAAVKQAVTKGIVSRGETIIKSWQFGFDLSKKEGLLPTIYHANFKPEGWLPNIKYSNTI